MTSFNVTNNNTNTFLLYIYEKSKQQDQNLLPGEIFRICASKWDSRPEDERKPYNDAAISLDRFKKITLEKILNSYVIKDFRAFIEEALNNETYFIRGSNVFIRRSNVFIRRRELNDLMRKHIMISDRKSRVHMIFLFKKFWGKFANQPKAELVENLSFYFTKHWFNLNLVQRMRYRDLDNEIDLNNPENYKIETDYFGELLPHEQQDFADNQEEWASPIDGSVPHAFDYSFVGEILRALRTIKEFDIYKDNYLLDLYITEPTVKSTVRDFVNDLFEEKFDDYVDRFAAMLPDFDLKIVRKVTRYCLYELYNKHELFNSDVLDFFFGRSISENLKEKIIKKIKKNEEEEKRSM